MKIKISKKSSVLLIGSMMFCQSLTAMESPETTKPCDELASANYTPTVVHQSFADYQLATGGNPLKLLFPGGRDLYNPGDMRGDQQKHEGFYTIDQNIELNPHLQGSIFNENLWAEIPDNTIDLIHTEEPGALFFYGFSTGYGRQEKDDFLLRKVSEKCRVGGNLFVDLRYSRFWPLPNLLPSLSLQEASEQIERMEQEDPDFFMGFSYEYHKEHYASYGHKLLGDSEDEIYDILKKAERGQEHDRKKLDNLRERVNEIENKLSKEKLYQLQSPYAILFSKHTREKIFDQYDVLFQKYGFQRMKPVIELSAKIGNGSPFLPPLQKVGSRVIYEGMCFLDTIAEYEKVEYWG
jgi:hypothetical protein